MGYDWPVALRYKITQPIERGGCKVNKQPVKSNEVICEISPEEQRSPEVRQLEREFPNSREKAV